ncbi:threonylcarbamoyl-AMP synthase [Methylobacterium sp. W2]|uniref:L-threonylcarbamoyladenylate synthase n=1 Tax=Methylobacterium sp. W2 TaxID=2598107 RepID=UPI001D0C956A|nr:L-threonylcarbamoyladenylate synthase [Methylobacterium sp. W2]MCC0805342.1 threonylcarbamoyl-AMP synthase [Methylobacterium sp. W2]
MNDLGSIPGKTLRLDTDEAGIARSAQVLRSGGLVAFPTETVYGLGADASEAEAVARIYAAKERPSFNPLIAHVPALDAARREGVFDGIALRLAEAFWPGPLTLVVPVASGGTVSDLARAGLPSVALRVPANPVALSLLRKVGRPVAAPSANRSGRVSPTCAEHVLADLDGRIAAILDGGSTQVGLESTVIACLDGRAHLLRPGGVTREALEAVLGFSLDAGHEAGAAPIGPGLLASHYAPRATVRLDASRVEPHEAVLLFGPVDPPGTDTATARLNLSAAGDLREAAAGLFSALRRLDEAGTGIIAVAPIPRTGLGDAINDRLRRAAAPR